MKLLVKCSAWFILALPGGVIGAVDIDWRHWELAAFEAAKAQDKVILLSVGMEGCAACRAALSALADEQLDVAIQQLDSLSTSADPFLAADAIRAIATDSAISRAPSSIPGRMCVWISIIRLAWPNPAAAPH